MRTLLVASPGGHLDELRIMADLLEVDTHDAVWVTGRNAQTESLLSGEQVIWIPRVGSGQMAKAALGLPRALRIQQRVRPELLVSTGALFSTPHLLAATLRRCETWFIDSATRVKGPSSTGRFAQHMTRARLFVQGEGWGDPAWTSVPGVFDAFEASSRAAESEPVLATAVVSLGTELWPFDRAIAAALRVLDGFEVTWQTGTTRATGHDGRPLDQWLPATELHSAFGAADVVITHAGVGSVLAVLEQGKVPVILARRARAGEMVDDHQVEFASMIERLGLAIVAEPEELSPTHLTAAAALSAHRRPVGTRVRPAAQPAQIPLPRR
ncbi:MAG: glycosyltransferase [Nocardioides sp.]|uniref:glycosyltransferase n=1 Tax=Nocardioides sp. TaxID=35761 RepID=UPI0039E4B915